MKMLNILMSYCDVDSWAWTLGMFSHICGGVE